MRPSAFVAAFNSPDAPCPVCGVALGSSMTHDAPECIAVLRRHQAEGAAEMMSAAAVDACIAIVNEARFNRPRDLRELITEMEALRTVRADCMLVTPALRAAVEAVREARADADAHEREYGPASALTIRREHDADRARLRLADLLLAALPPVKP